MSAADPAGALAAYLSSRIPALSGNVFRPELPPANDPLMPRACVVIRPAGGYGLFGNANAPIGDPTLDIFCYGSSWLESEQLALTVIPALRSLRTATWQNTRLMWARIAGGPNPMADPETDWPCTVISAQVAHCELAIS